MVKKLLLKVFTFWALILTSAMAWGQCPSSVSISADTGNTICSGTNVTFTATANGGSTPFTYQWNINGSPVGSASTSNIFSTDELTNGQKVSVTITDGNGTTCSISSSDFTMTVNTTKTPTVSISSNKTSICPGDSVTFTAANTNGGTNPQYSFFLNSSTTALQSGSSNTYTTTGLNNGDRIRVLLTSSLECTTSDIAQAESNTIEVKPGAPAQPGAITGAITEVCPGDSQSYSISPVANATSYQWTLPSGWSGSSSSNSITTTAGTSGGVISVVAVNNCGTSEAQTINVTVDPGEPSTPGNITGETAVCPGVSQTYSITAVSDATEYIWTLPSGWTGASTTNSITVTTGTTGGNISVQAKNSCGTSSAKVLAVSTKAGKPAQPTPITGSTQVCPNVQQTYSISPITGASSYIWTLPNGWTGSSTTNSITVTTGATGGDIKVKATNDCDTGNESILAITVKPGTPAQPAAFTVGPAEVCPGTSATYTVPAVSGASQYIWTIPSSFSATSLITTTPTLTITAGSTGSGTITIKAKNDCGTSTARSMAISISKPAPVMSGTITGPSKVCSTAKDLVYSIPAITNATEYIWTLPNGWTGTSTTNSITVSASSFEGNISVQAKNSCGSSSTTSLAVKVNNTVPAQPGAITSSLSNTSAAICPPASGITFEVPETSGMSYTWTVPAGFVITSGQGTNKITVNITATTSYSTNAKVDVVATNSCGPSIARSFSNISIDKFVVTNLGDDQTLCPSTSTLTLNGFISFGTGNTKLKVASITSSGTNQVQGIPNGQVNDFTYQYTPSAQDLATGKVTFTLTTEKPAGSCAAGTDSMTVFFKPLPTATITSTGPICSGNTSTLTFAGTPNSRVTYKLPNNTTQTIDIGTSGTASVTTAALTATSTYTLVSAINLDTPACTNNLSGSTIITVTPKPTATITYAGTPFCSSVTTAQTPTLSGTNAYSGGSYSSTAGLSLNTSTGAINPSTSTPGTYTVTYSTPDSGGCAPVTTTTQITITKQPTASITYSGTPFCTSDSAAKNITLTGTDAYTGGTFSAPAGLTIDPNTGEITPSNSTAGTYTVTYSTPNTGGCAPITATTEVTITKAPTITTFSYPDGPFCKADNSTYPPNLTGTDSFTGGTFSAPAGLSIDSTTGAINPGGSTVGSYTVTYTSQPKSGCGAVTATTEVKITETPKAEISYTGPYCTSDSTAYSPVFSNTAGVFEGGIFRSTPQGLNLDPSSGAINANASSPNTYTVFYELPSGEGCSATEISTSVTITQVPQVEISYPTPICTSDTESHPVTFSTSSKGAYQDGTFTSTTGLVIDNSGNIIAANSTPGVHTITYTTKEAIGCGPVTATTTVEIFEKVQITTEPVNIGVCSTEPASFEVVATGDNLTYQWKRTDGATITNATGINSAKLSFSNATAANAGVYFVEVSGSSPCSMVSSEKVTLNVDENIVIIKPTEDITFCDQERTDVTFEFIAHAKGAPLTFTWIKDGVEISGTNTSRFTFSLTGPVGDNGEYTGKFIISGPNPSDNGVYAVKIKGPDYFTCSGAVSKNFSLNVTPLPEPPTTAPVVLCQGGTAEPLTATGATGATFKWYDADMLPLEGTPTPSTIEAGSTSYFVTQTTEVCESTPTELVVSVNPTPILPTTQVEVHYCFDQQNISALSADLTDSAATLNWYGPNDSSISLDAAPTPSTTSTGNTKYWVSQSIGDCESDLVEILVVIDPLPEIAVSADSELICKGSSTVLHATGADSYSWSVDGTEIGTTADLEIFPTQTTTYTLTGTNNTGCTNFTEITIEVDENTIPGTLTGPGSVCITSPTGILTLSGEIVGDILRWEKSEDGGTSWTEIAETTPTYSFTGLTKATSFRAIVKSGVCDAVPSNQVDITIDPLPVGGELNFAGVGRVFMICEGADSGYAVDLNLTGITGEVVEWQYRSSSATSWTTISGVLGATLTEEKIEELNISETTVFQVIVKSGACQQYAVSKTAILSVIPTDIAPSPVTVDPGVVCFGEQVTLSSETGYTTGSTISEDGAFDNASITQHGWRVRRNGSTTDIGFDTDANNTQPDRWKRATPHPFTTASLKPNYGATDKVWGSGIEDGNKGFAVVSSNNSATMETPVFSIGAMDQAVLTFDQAYNLTPGSSIMVEISTDGGTNYNTVLYSKAPTESDQGITSGHIADFGLGTKDTRPENKIEIDLGNYLGRSNLRIRFSYVGTRTGDVWAIDNIKIPDGPQGVEMEWNDYTDPNNPVFIGNNTSEQYSPTQIGWNNFEVKTKLVFDSEGNACEIAENSETIKVFVFDTYTSAPTANSEPCENNSATINAVVTGANQGPITNFPTDDGYVGQWEVTAGPEGYAIDPSHFSPSISSHDAVFTPDNNNGQPIIGNFTLRWVMTNNAVDADGNPVSILETCPYNPVEVTVFIGCPRLDFDGVDDYVDLGNSYTGTYSVEAWIRPEADTGTIISLPKREINMEDLPNEVLANGRWYHIAVDSNGKLYVDGIDVGQKIETTGTENRAYIGAKWETSSATNHFSGWIEEVRIWNGLISQKNIKFTMNQRLKATGNIGVEVDMVHPDAPDFSNLIGYYQLIADPAIIMDGGYTEDLSYSPAHGKLVNMTTLQENTAPLPYTTSADGTWFDENGPTWTHADVWDPPYSEGIVADANSGEKLISWNIAKVAHDVKSGSKDIKLLGLLSESNSTSPKTGTLDMEGTNPSSWTAGVGGSGNELFISHYLLLNGIIDLNGESQLVQPMGSIVDAKSGGHLDRDQQGTASSYNYNYWVSPVGPGASNAAYTVKSVLLDGSDPDNPQGLDFGDPYAYADGGPSNPKKISTYWLHKFHGTANNYFEWNWIGDDEESLEAGEGFSMKGTIGSAAISVAQNYTFRGLPNNGDVIPGTTGPQQNYLIGNPYPSAIDANQFIADNLGTGNNVFNGTIYFWSHFAEQTHYLEEYVGGYAAYNISGGVMAISVDDRIDNSNPNRSGGQVPQQYIPVGQAFFINTMVDDNLAATLQNAGLPTEIEGGQVLFQNSQRIFVPEKNDKGGSVFNSQKKKELSSSTNSSSSQEVVQNKIWLKFKSPKGFHRQILVTADPRSTNNFDLGFDAPMIDQNVEDMYWYFSNYQFVIQGVPDFNVERVLDLGIKVEQKGAFSISIDDLDNIPDEMNIYVADSLLKVVHDLRESPYETESEAGTFTDRFKLVFQDKTQIEDPEVPVIEEGPFEVLYVTGTRNVLLRNPELLQVERVYLNNMLGQQVHVYYNIPSEKEVELPVNRFSAGVYIVKVHYEGGVMTRKVILE